MTEAQFWAFLENLWRRNGREPQMSGMIDSPDPWVQAASHYITSHCLLPKGYDKISGELVFSIGRLLLEKGIQRRTREAIMMILAHHGSEEALYALEQYNMRPNKGLEIFAETALNECRDWNSGEGGGIFIV